jgi:glycosyltransferase involved in cell wall biosynthesis
MHICYCYHVFYPVNGGVEQNIMNVSRELIKRGHKVTVVTSSVPNRPDREFYNGIEILRTKPLFWLFKVPFMPRYKKLLSSVDADIIHAHGTVPGVSDTAILYASKKGIPSVLTYHFDGYSDSLVGKIAAFFYNVLINKRVVSKTNRIIALSKAYIETSPVLKENSEKIDIIPNGVDLKKFNPDVDVSGIREKYKLPEKNVIIFVGRFVKTKGIEYLIKAMKYVDKGTLLLVGGGELEPELRKLVHEEKLDEKVRFLGFLPNEDLPKLYGISDAFVLPSLSESFGVVLLEAMACGVPLIVSDLPRIKQFLSEDFALKVKPMDFHGFAEKINYMLSNQEIRRKMGENARSFAKDYSWEAAAEKISDVYNEITR